MSHFERIQAIEKDIDATYPGESYPFKYGVVLARLAFTEADLEEARKQPHPLAVIPCPFTDPTSIHGEVSHAS